jgi:hypothetical protein
MKSGVHLSRATVVKIEPVTAETAITYLRSTLLNDSRWQPLLDHLWAEPDDSLAAALLHP